MENTQEATQQQIPSTPMTMQLVANVVASYVSNHVVPMSELSNLINTVHESLGGTAAAPAASAVEAEKQKPAVPVRKSIDPNGEFIICLEDGKQFKSMKRHLSSSYGMTPEQYREKWNLPADYPMVARNYAEHRSQLAKDMGLGRPAGRAA